MDNREQLQAIKANLMARNNWTADQAVWFIADQVGRAPKTVYSWLSTGDTADIPDHMLELLEFKLKALAEVQNPPKG